METPNAPVTAERSRKRRSDAIYPNSAARQRAYRARRKAAREAERVAMINEGLAARGSTRRLRVEHLTPAFYGLLGNAAKKAIKQERERVDSMNPEEYVAYLLSREPR